MTSAALIGSTGLIGSQILSTLIALPAVSSVDILARRESKASSTSKLTSFIDADTSKWPIHLSSIKPPPSLFFSALATTRAAAGGFDKQHAFEHGFNIEMAKAAKAAGVKVFVLISSGMTSRTSWSAYSRMKAEIEDDIKALDFEHTVIVKPGLLVGDREESRMAEGLLRGMAKAMGAVSQKYLKDFWAQDDVVVARAAVKAGLICLDGKSEGHGKVWEVMAADIIRLGRTEWKQ